MYAILTREPHAARVTLEFPASQVKPTGYRLTFAHEDDARRHADVMGYRVLEPVTIPDLNSAVRAARRRLRTNRQNRRRRS